MSEVKNYYTDFYGNITASDDQLRDCVNDLLVVIASMQEKIENLSGKVEGIEDKILENIIEGNML